MDSECGESASHFVKEELDIEDVDFSEEPSDREEDLNLPEATDLRCGEVYLGCNGSFTFVCSICANCFPNSELFQAHVQDAHFQLNTENIYDDPGDAVAECNDQDTLSNSPSVGGPFTEQILLGKASIKKERDEEDMLDGSEIADKSVEGGVEATNQKPQTSDETNMFISCRFCRKSYDKYKSYVEHARVAHGIITRRMRTRLILQAQKAAIKSKLSKGKRFRCILCTRSFTYRRMLRYHVENEHGDEALKLHPELNTLEDLNPNEEEEDDESSPFDSEKNHDCNLCGRRFRHKRSLQTHIQTYHEKEATCSPQNETKVQENLQPNTVERKERKIKRKFYCRLCTRSFKYRRSFHSHVETEHADEAEKLISESNLIGSSAEEDSEGSSSDPDEIYPCKLCDRIYKLKGSLRIHVRKYHGESIMPRLRKFYCNVCNRSYKHTRSLFSHVGASHGAEALKLISQSYPEEDLKANDSSNEDDSDTYSIESEKNYTCPICDHKFGYQRSMEAHIKKYHGEQALCPPQNETDKQETQKENPNENKNADPVMIVKRKFYCKLCNRSYKHRRSFLSHVGVDHGPEALSELKADESDDENEDESSLLEPRKNYACKLCDRHYRHSRSLRVHIKRHHGEEALSPRQIRRFCKYCSETFDSLETLQAHTKSIHPRGSDRKIVQVKFNAPQKKEIGPQVGKPPYKCTYCSKEFPELPKLAIHIRTHL
ncbi:unnamed protein product [Hermetia illucens]|uniref:C2H2-type domain-containing protein n=1 Tax=Hermetia illucens TaxID=343691 RepID=A0A7R8UVU4_HERIL|nr:zinc finger protein 77-like [Hermetia illucens]CAD7086828.1 unnamed protein product [Hermetia illucens]